MNTHETNAAQLPASAAPPDGAPASAESANLLAARAELENVKSAHKLKKNEKQICSREYGKAKAQGEDISELQQTMQRVSAELDQLTQQRKDLELQISLLQDQKVEPAIPPFPQRFAQREETSVDLSTIDSIDDERSGEWDAYVGSHPQASPYHLYAWRTIVTTSFGHESHYLTARDASGKICGVLPWVRLRSHLFGDFGVSLPFFNYGGALADNSRIREALLKHAAGTAKGLQLKHLEIRATETRPGWPERTDKVSMIRTLPSSQAALAEELGAKLRAQINRARQENPSTHIGRLELLDDFYRVFSLNMRDLGTPVYGKSFFANILSRYPESCIVVVKYKEKPVAAAFLVGYKDMMEIPWASTLRKVNTLSMNMLLYWEVLSHCIQQGYRYFDFGRSTIDSGTFRFKRQWGAEPLPHYWQYWLANGDVLPDLKPDSPKFRLLIAAWQRLPVAISRLLGPHIVKYLP